jgi:PAS domain S-box-containing protein
MESYQQEITLIKKVLSENPKGMTVTDISRKIKINRNSVAKYLDIMRISGHVEMITFGPAKVFFPSRRIPILDMLNLTSDYILVFDSKFKILMANDSFLNFMKIPREDLIGQLIPEMILKVFKDHPELLVGIKEALDGKKITQDIDIQQNKERYFFSVSIVPTTFEDGRHGGTIVIKNITDNKLAENALKESEENFKSLLKKINKK